MYQQNDLFDDPRFLCLNNTDKWNIYRNPTPYQAKQNEMFYECVRTLWLIEWYEKKARGGA